MSSLRPAPLTWPCPLQWNMATSWWDSPRFGKWALGLDGTAEFSRILVVDVVDLGACLVNMGAAKYLPASGWLGNKHIFST